MGLVVGVLKETFPQERRVAMIPAQLGTLLKAGLEVLVESGAGQGAGYTDQHYQDKGARIGADRKQVFAEAGLLCQVRGLGANPSAGRGDLELLREGQVLLAMQEPLAQPELMQELAGTGVQTFAMELIPRITRAQSMDVLSSMATIAGYLASILAAQHLPRFFPMFMTAAGTITPARAFVLGAGVAGLQAIATCRRLGARVIAYDIRPETKEQVESVGGRFLELDIQGAADEQGYAKEQSADQQARQRELMKRTIHDSDVVITTANVPGRKAPVLVTTDMVEGMAPGSVVVDLAAEKGGNCEVTRAGEVVTHQGVTVLGPINLAGQLSVHASQMYARNIATLIDLLVTEGELQIDFADEIVVGTLVSRDGQVVHDRVRELLELEPLEAPAAESEPATDTLDGDEGEAPADAKEEDADADADPPAAATDLEEADSQPEASEPQKQGEAS